MANIAQLLTEHIDIWTAADAEKKSGRGRASGNAGNVYGVKKLRELILELAVRGKLVQQDTNDEPASELLKRIQAEKVKLIIEGKLKKEKPLAPISDDEKPFELPNGWKWARLQEVYDVRDGTHDTPKYQEIGFPLVTSKNLYSGTLDFSDIKYISESDHLKIKDRSKVDKGDILFAMIGSIGNPVLVDTDIEFSIKNVALFKPYSAQLSDTSYLLKYLIKASINLRDEAAGAVQSFVSLGVIRNYLIPFPPLAEQHRIVAKVDALMALCDQLKTRMQQANQQQQAIANALVAQALQPTAEIINLADYRAATACYAIKKMQGKSYFGRTAAMKVLYLAEAHLGLSLNFQPMREAAGPLDKWIYAFEKQGENEGWFKVIETDIGNGKTKVEYHAKSAIAQKSVLIQKICTGDQLKEFDRLLGLFAVKTTEEAEIIATLFAAWNDFLIDGNTPTDDEIVKEVRENWHESKARFTPKQLKESLNWMRRKYLVPIGRQPRTVYQQLLITN